MKRLAALLPFLALFLSGCDENGRPTTDVEAIMFGSVFIAALAAAAFAIWCVTR